MTIADLIQSTIDSSKERIKTPITGAFICSFILYNWQPLLILLLSDATIECRIKVAKTYFNKISFIWPAGMALIFTIAIPILMWGLDSVNIFAKKKRLSKSFQNKRNYILEKIKLTDDSNRLKDKESGNKEKQDYIDKIAQLEDTVVQLEESKKQIEVANKISVDQLNSKLKEVNDSYQNFINDPQQYVNLISKIDNKSENQKAKEEEKNYQIELKSMSSGKFTNWQLDQIFTIADLDVRYDRVIDVNVLDQSLLRSLMDLQVISKTIEGNFKLTNEGIQFIAALKNGYPDDYNKFRFNNDL